MGIKTGDGSGEELKIFLTDDTFTVNNFRNRKPPMSPSILSSASASVLAVSLSESSVTNPVEASYGYNVEEEEEEEEEEEDFEWVAVDNEVDVTTDKAPEIDEVEDAFSAFQLMFNDDESQDQVSESEEFVDWIEPPLQLCTTTTLLQPYMLDRLYDAFHVFQTDPAVQRMVMSLASDRAVWDAVMKNDVVRELINNAEMPGEDSASAANCSIKRLFERSAIKVMDAMERVTKYVTDLFNIVVPGNETAVLATDAAPMMEKLQTTVLLAIVVLLIVLVTRATRGR